MTSSHGVLVTDDAATMTNTAVVQHSVMIPWGRRYEEWKLTPRRSWAATIPATVKSTARQNGGHHRVPCTKWVRCCHRSLAPWARYMATTSHGVTVTAQAAAMKKATTTVVSAMITF